MTTRTRRRHEHDDEEGRERRRPAKKDNTAVVVGSIFVVAIIAIGFAGYMNRNKAKAAVEAPKTESEPEQSPFADIAPEEGPQRMSPGGKRLSSTSLAPVELLDEPVWTAAQAKVAEARAILSEAEEAKGAGDNATYLDKAVRGKKMVDEAIIATADWETDIQGRYGDSDVLVRKIVRERSRWFELLRKYHGL